MEENNLLPNFEDHIPGKVLLYGIMGSCIGLIFLEIYLIAQMGLEITPLVFDATNLLIWIVMGAAGGFLVIHDRMKKKRKKLSYEGAFTVEQFEDIIPSTIMVMGWSLLIVIAAILFYYHEQKAFMLMGITLGQTATFIYIKKRYADFKLELQFYTTK